jgi:thioredoxin-dependent peroxiredoxin
MATLAPGKKAPNFTLDSSGGGKVSLADLKGKFAVLYFYPKDATPGCTREAEAFRDSVPKLAKKNAVVYGISKDSVESHDKFCSKLRLTFPLLSDPDGKMIEAYGAWGEKTLYGKKYMGTLRSTVIVGPDGKVFKVFPKVKPEDHAKEVLEALPTP